MPKAPGPYHRGIQDPEHTPCHTRAASTAPRPLSLRYRLRAQRLTQEKTETETGFRAEQRPAEEAEAGHLVTTAPKHWKGMGRKV